MPKRIAPLSDRLVSTVKPAAKAVRIFDGGGLYLEVSPEGGKLWRLKYRFDGKEKRLALGQYPDVSLADAREKREIARKQVAAGIDPGFQRKAQKALRAEQGANSFEVVAREWVEKFSARWTPGYASLTLRRLELHVFPWIGAKPIADIEAPELLRVLQRVESAGKVTSAHKVKVICGQVFRYAIATGRAKYDLAAGLKGALLPKSTKHFGALVKPGEVAGLMRAIDAFNGSFVTKCALRLSPLLFVRPGELRAAEWEEFDLDKGEWTIPAAKMKMRMDHLVPLAPQSLAILRELHALTGHERFVFPSERKGARCMSENTILAALRRLGYSAEEMTPHGFRAMARTLLEEELSVPVQLIEHQLAHSVKDANGRAYNRTTHIAERRKMMKLWAEYLDGLKAGAKVIPLRIGNEG